MAERSRTGRGLFVRAAQRIVLPLTLAFAILTTVNFLGPALVLGSPDPLREPMRAIFDVVAVALIAVQLTVLAVATPLLVSGPTAGPPNRLVLLTVSAGIAIAIANAARLALGARGAGLGPQLAEVALFVAPLVLLSVAVWQRVPRDAGLWWAGAMRLILVAFPLVFLMASLSRVDFRPYAGAPVSSPLAWFLTYGPTLIVSVLPLMSWIAMESLRAPRRSFVIDAGIVLSVSILVAAATSVNSSAAFVLSATVTWGSGYQLFVAPSPFPPLFFSFLLLSAAFASFAVVLFRLRPRASSRKAPLLALLAVLSGVFASAISILGSFAALELMAVEVSCGIPPR